MFDFLKKKKGEEFVAFADGKVILLENVNDEVFAKKMMGEGIAIEPTDGNVYSPLSGKVKNAFPTGHAYILEDLNGVEYLIHCGLDTVELKGEGFEGYVKEGDSVKQGDKICKMNLDLINEKGKDTVIIAVSEELFKDKKFQKNQDEKVSKGDIL